MGEVISKSASIIAKNPIIMLPQAILFVPTLLSNLPNVPAFDPLRIILGLAAFVFGVMVGGAYPSMVKTIVEGGQPSVTDALGRAYRKFWTLLGAGILVVLIVALGFIALIVPGIIFITWYAYTSPAVMMEDKRAREAMAASKAFGRDKKGSTFLMLLVFGGVGIALYAIQAVLSLASPLLGSIAYAILDVPLAAWISVALAYTYLTYGPSSVKAATEVSGFEGPSPFTGQPSVQADAPAGVSSTRFCASCGSPVQADSKFCRNCGKPV